MAAIGWAGCGKKRSSKPAPSGDDAAPASSTDHDAAATAAADPFDTWLRVEATIDELGIVPFFVGIDDDEDRGVVRNGDEDIAFVVVSRKPLHLRIPVRGIELELEETEPGQYKGTWQAGYFFKRSFELTASEVAEPSPFALFVGDEPPAVDLSGQWRFDIEEFGVGRADFRQDQRGVISGSITPPEVGDMRFMMGRVTGRQLRMSVFDGIHGFLIEATANPAGNRLEGRWLIGGIGNFPLVAQRQDVPELDSLVSARLAPGKTRITLPALETEPFVGKPVIVDLFGTWCPACIDMTPELVRLHQQYKDQGLQMLSIALEPDEGEAEARRRVQEYRDEFDVTWPIDLRLTDDYLSHIPPEIEKATGFPVTVWIRPNGEVHAVHTGFFSAAVPDQHEAVLAKFRRWTEEIVTAPKPAVTNP